MQNRATCKAIWLSLFCMPEVSKTLQHGLQHNVTFFWICVMIIWIIQKTLRKKLGRLHQRPVEDLIVAAAEQQSQINLPKTMKFGSQKHLVCKAPAIRHNLRMMTCHRSIQAVTVALPVILLCDARNAHATTIYEKYLLTEYASRNLGKQSKPNGAGSFENRYSN